MILPLLSACRYAPDEPVPAEPAAEEPITDTFPAFRGEVPRNLLMVSIDTYRRDLLARSGGVGLSPFLDDKAATGLVLDRHRACSNWTLPGVLCVTQGTTNIDAGYVPDLNDGAEAIATDHPTLAGRLADAGWYTALVTSNSWLSADHNGDVGFASSERPDDRTATGVFEVGAQRLIDAQVAGVDRWYLHLHVREPHSAYDPPEAYLEGLESLEPVPWDLGVGDEHYDSVDAWPAMTEEERALLLEHLLVRYAGEVRWLDDQLAAAFASLEAAGMLDDTLVVFWTDHGEQFWEHGEQTHAYGLNLEENDAVAILWSRSMQPAVWSEPTSHIDLAPTLLDLFGLEIGPEMTGVPVGQADPERVLDFVSVARLGPVQSVVHDDWKLVYRWTTGERWLYDLASDPLELTDLYDPQHSRAVALEASLAPRVDALEPLVSGYPRR